MSIAVENGESKRNRERSPELELVFERIRPTRLARLLKGANGKPLTPQAVHLWTRIPDEHVADVAVITGLSPRVIAPESYHRFLVWQELADANECARR